MATQFRNQQEIYREASTAHGQPSVSAVLAYTPFAEFARDIMREAAEIRGRYAEVLALPGDDDD
jgi:hypothetical protein